MEIEPQTSLPQNPPTSQSGRRRSLAPVGHGTPCARVCFSSVSFFFVTRLQNAGWAQDSDNREKPNIFVGWNKPDLAIVISGQMYGYLQPCGCFRSQKGRLKRGVTI